MKSGPRGGQDARPRPLYMYIGFEVSTNAQVPFIKSFNTYLHTYILKYLNT